MNTQPLTVQQLAAYLKERIPQLKDAPDEELVRKVLARRPELITKLSNPPAGPNRDLQGTRPTDFSTRVIDRLGENVEGAVRMPQNISKAARERFLELHPENAKQSTMERLKSLPSTAADIPRSWFDAIYSGGLAPAAKGIYGVTPPGIAGRMLEGEDPAKLTGDALTFFAPGGEEAGARTHTVIDRTKAGPLRGSMTRGAALMDRLDLEARDIPVDHNAAYKYAKQAEALQKYGYQVPAPIKAYIDMIESRLKGGKDPIFGRPGEFVDRSGTTQPLTYQDARNFESSLGARIDWDDPGGKMNAIQKKMREALGNDTAAALRPYGLDVPYRRAKAEFSKAYGAEAKWGPFGYFGGKIAGYGAGAFTGHPLIMGYAGGKLGESAAGSLVRSIARAGERGAEPGMEAATRRAGGGASPVERMKMATDQVNSLKMHLERNPGDYNAVTKLRAAEDSLRQAQQDAFPPGYKSSPQIQSRQGGGGANYTAEDLAKLKERMGLK